MSEYVFRYAHGFGGELDECDHTDNVDHFGTLHEEIVRCRDCRHGYRGVCERPIWGDGERACAPIEPSGFCSWGKRRNQ